MAKQGAPPKKAQTAKGHQEPAPAASGSTQGPRKAKQAAIPKDLTQLPQKTKIKFTDDGETENIAVAYEQARREKRNLQSLFPAHPQWYIPSSLTALPDAGPSTQPPLMASQIAALHSRASTLLDSLQSTSNAATASKSELTKSKADQNFLTQILTSGTHSDKLSALTLLVQSDPIRNIKALETLSSLMGRKEGQISTKGGRTERVQVARAVADWWVSTGCPPRKLKYFRDQASLLQRVVGKEDEEGWLAFWAFENWLKTWFFGFLEVLEALSHDTQPFVRSQAISIIFMLLKEKPEQEQNLLRLMVNKLGDSDKTVASKASYHTLQLLQAHPSMKSVVVREISQLVLAPLPLPPPKAKKSHNKKSKKSESKAPDGDKEKRDGANHARYYGIITLNQTTLTVKDKEVASKLVEVYFEVFRELLGDGKSGIDETEADALIVAEPTEEDKQNGAKGDKKTKRDFRDRRSWDKKKQVPAGGDGVEESEGKMIAAVLAGVNRALPFAKMEDASFAKHMDTLFKITHIGTFNISIQALSLISLVTSSATQSVGTTAASTVTDRFYRTLYDSLMDPRLASSSKQAMYLNLLFKSLKAPACGLPRAAALIKRLIQICSMQQPSFICGTFFLLGELFSTVGGLKRLLNEPEEEDEEERFVDADKKVTAADGEEAPEVEKKWAESYDGRKRDPRYAHAEKSCLWEMTPFLSHYHPTVSLCASQLLSGQPITSSSDLTQNTLIHFLDRFVYRNAKKVKAKGVSLMQPAAIAGSEKLGVVKGGASGGDLEVNSRKFWDLKEEEVDVDQLFFHKFFSAKLAKDKKAKSERKAKNDGGDDDDDVGESEDEEDKDATHSSKSKAKQAIGEGDEPDEDEAQSDLEEDEIWKAMQASMPEIADDEDLMEDDSDDDVSEDLEDDDDDIVAGGLDEDQIEPSDIDDSDDSDEDEEDVDSADGQIDDAEFDSDDEVAFEFADEEGEDLDDDELVGMDAIPENLLIDEEAEEVDPKKVGKRKRNEDAKKERKKRKALPLFGSYEDWQKIIEDGAEDNI